MLISALLVRSISRLRDGPGGADGPDGAALGDTVRERAFIHLCDEVMGQPL